MTRKYTLLFASRAYLLQIGCVCGLENNPIKFIKTTPLNKAVFPMDSSK
jgi:hypothetical protein